MSESAYSQPRPYTLQTTGRLARDSSACPSGYEKMAAALGGEDTYGLDTPIGLDTIAETSGITDALWALRCVLPEQRELADVVGRLFAARVAFDVLPIFERHRPGDDRPRNAIRVARRYALGELRDAAWDAAGDAARAAAWDAARAAAWDAAGAAAGAAAWDAAGAAAWDAAGDAARAAARDAARDAAGDAARAAACDAAWDAAGDAAWDAAGDAMKTLFIAILRGEVALDAFVSLDT
jgi:hypothetical protein